MEHPLNSEEGQFSKSSSSLCDSKFDKLGRSFYYLTLFPEIFESVLGSSLLGKARDKGLVSFSPINIRDFSEDKWRRVDDSPYGGGPGMVLRVDILHKAWQTVMAHTKGKNTCTVVLSPQGKRFDQAMARELSEFESLVFVCGHYEGLDERFFDLVKKEKNFREVSVGDYVLTGGELPALTMTDAITRILPGVVGNEESIEKESLENGKLKYGQYTRPRMYEGLAVPEVLLSGNHAEISKWRETQSLNRTAEKRPDLL